MSGPRSSRALVAAALVLGVALWIGPWTAEDAGGRGLAGREVGDPSLPLAGEPDRDGLRGRTGADGSVRALPGSTSADTPSGRDPSASIERSEEVPVRPHELRLLVRWEDGEPAAGFRVARAPRHPGDTWATVGETDGAGRCTPRLSGPGPHLLGLAQDELGLALALEPLQANAEPVAVFLPARLRPRPCVGRVVDGGDEVVPGAGVTVRGEAGAPTLIGDRVPRTRTDGTGHFEVFASPSARVEVRAGGSTFPATVRVADLLADPLVVLAREVELRLRDGGNAGQLWLTVRDGNGQELPWEGSRTWAGSAVLSEDGARITVPETARTLEVRRAVEDALLRVELRGEPGVPVTVDLP